MRVTARFACGVVAAFLVSGCAASQMPYPAAPLEGTTIDGDALALEDLRGEVVLVTMWASWCGPCRDEVPVFEDALDQWADDGLTVLGVNFRDNADAAAQFVASEDVSFQSVLDPDGRIGVSWGVRALPQTFLVNRSGEIVARQAGTVDHEWIAAVVPLELTS